MSDTPIVEGAPDDRSPQEAEPRSATGLDGARESARAVAEFGPWLGWGLLAIGVLVGLGRGVEPMVGPTSPARWIGAALEGAGWILAFGLAGRAATVSCRLVAALVLAWIERGGKTDDPFTARAARTTAEEIAAANRSQALVEIERALKSDRWAEAESLIDAFARALPEDSTLHDLRDRLDAGRRQGIEAQMAQLEAARKVNDPARVIELYQGIVPLLDAQRREELARDLAKWFLELIHRRLRTGKIQAEVVLLATQVAETFGATVEGASMRAALPTLRRSVGLCPRCAQPYTGVAEACPQCMAGASAVAARPASEHPPISS